MSEFRAPLDGPPPDWRGAEPTSRTVTTRPATTDADTASTARRPMPGNPSLLRRIGRGIRSGIKWLALSALAYLVVVGVLIVAYRFVNPATTTLILMQRAVGQPISQRWVPLERISPHLVRAVIMSEDARFCSHAGVDWREIEEAFERSQDGSVRGGSTISMQVAKNLFLWPSKSYLRKALEIPITYAMEAAWPKARMLEIYLNIAEWGPGIFGAESAANVHFKKSAARLSEADAALLAVALPSPLTRDPGRPSAGTQRLADTIRTRMTQASPYVACIPSTTERR